MDKTDCSTIMAILIDKRTDAVPKVQGLLTEHGYIISTRLGMHQVGGRVEEGLIMLHLCGSQDDINTLERELSEVHRVKVKKMRVSFDE